MKEPVISSFAPARPGRQLVGCEQSRDIKAHVNEYIDALMEAAHRIGGHGMDRDRFWESGLFFSAIERIRGSRAALTRQKRSFISVLLDYMKAQGFIEA